MKKFQAWMWYNHAYVGRKLLWNRYKKFVMMWECRHAEYLEDNNSGLNTCLNNIGVLDIGRLDMGSIKEIRSVEFNDRWRLKLGE